MAQREWVVGVAIGASVVVGSLAVLYASTSMPPGNEGSISPTASSGALGPTGTATATSELSRSAQDAIQILNTVALTTYEADGHFRDAFG